MLPRYRLELVREKASRYDADDKRVSTPEDARRVLELMFQFEKQAEEIFAMLVLDTKNQIIGGFEVSRGSVNSSIVHPREVFKRAILVNASSIIIAHNHPSGDVEPSHEDIVLTNRLQEGGRLLGVSIMDHIVCGMGGKYYSFREEGDI